MTVHVPASHILMLMSQQLAASIALLVILASA